MEASFQYQHRLPLQETPVHYEVAEELDVAATLRRLLTLDLTFKGEKTSYATHSLHAFAAKFPPQLPQLFIRELTRPGEVVLDPMVGSGTTLVEAVLAGRQAVGVDLDPLAVLVSQVKSRPMDIARCAQVGAEVLQRARERLPAATGEALDVELSQAYSPKAIQFFRYWFEEHTVAELYALAQAIQAVEAPAIRDFLQVVFSAIIITKSGGVTRARDLAHSRPHRVLTKQVNQNALDVFSDRLRTSIEALEHIAHATGRTTIYQADARSLPLEDNSVDLIVTSPPYAANAIDYMRAHKFSLIWFRHAPKALSTLRSNYIGAELQASDLAFASETANRVLQALQQADGRRAAVVAHYYRDMEAVLREMLRVLNEGRAAILVVGSSTIRGVEIEVPRVLAELAVAVGFQLVDISTREIVRNARLLPVSHNTERNGIEARMHEEGVIGLIKPVRVA